METQRGAVVALMAAVLLAALATLAAVATGAIATAARRDASSDRALALAREALVAHAADRPLDAVVGPGYLPCPDRDGDGWAEPTCGSLAGDVGQAQRLGRLPWKTLGLPDLRDGHGERLWYAVSTKHKGLLHCAASAACVDMSPRRAIGTITVRGATGEVIHDGRRADASPGGGAAAVVIAPGPPLVRADGREQRRGCEAACDPADFLDAAPESRYAFEDNAAFHDRSDAAGRAGNGDGFVQGPVVLAGGRLAVNDRIAVISPRDLMRRVMRRVAMETAHCLRSSPPLPTPACGLGDALGRVPDEALAAAGADCNASAAPGRWWAPWQPHVLLARGAPHGLDVVDTSGRVVARGRRHALLVSAAPGDCMPDRVACDGGGCLRATLRAAGPEPDALVTLP